MQLGEQKALVEMLFSRFSKNVDTSLSPINSKTTLLLGGFQGSGKTTILSILSAKLPVLIVSKDQITQAMFDAGIVFSDEFVSIREKIFLEIIDLALKTHEFVALDTNATEKVFENVRKLVVLKNYSHRLFSVLLFTPEKILEDRLRQRASLVNTYNGSVEELRDSMRKHGDYDKNLYNLTISTKENSTAEIVDTIYSHL